MTSLTEKKSLILLLLALIVAIEANAGTVRLVIGYCPTDFTGAGAIVDVDPMRGNWTIKTRFAFPAEIFGCVANYDPTFSLDPSDANTIWFDFVSDAAYFVAIDTRFGNLTAFDSSELFFTGFLDFARFASSNTLRGITGTATQRGYCNDGCIGYGIQDITTKGYKQMATLPFKETADDARFVDRQARLFYFQAAYDLNNVGCAPRAYEQCLLTVDADTGRLLNTTYSADQYQVFKYGRTQRRSDNTVAAFMGGAFDSFCKYQDPTTFGRVNLKTGQATPHACVPADVVIDTDQWVASFSPDETILATASGNGNGDSPQFLTLDVASGRVIVNSALPGLAQALKADMGLIFIWGVEFVA